jgi:hypothetical protein
MGAMRPLLLSLLVLAACSKPDESSPSEKIAVEDNITYEKKQAAKPKGPEPDFIVVDHILIAFNGAPKMSGVERSLAQAKDLAYMLLKQIQDGGDWAALKKQYSDDPGPTGEGGGPYAMTNRGALRREGAHKRSGMVPAFGDVGFGLAVGEVDIADYDATKSPYGYHIIKRVK